MRQKMESALLSLWFQPIPGHIFALIRIGIGLVGLAALAGLSNLELYWIPGGIESPSYSATKSFFVERGFGLEAGVAMFGLSLLSTLLMTVGLWTGLTVPLTFLLSLVQTLWNALPLSGAFSVYHCLLFCLIWPNSGSHWSVDRWMAKRFGSAALKAELDQLEPIWPLRLLRIQMGLIYLSAGVWKLAYSEWQTGAALHYVLAGNGFNRFPPPPPLLDPVVILSSYLVLGWELLFVPLILFRPTRTMTLWFGALAHIGMGIVLELGIFSAVMLVGYLAYLEPEWVAQRFAGRQRTAAATSAES